MTVFGGYYCSDYSCDNAETTGSNCICQLFAVASRASFCAFPESLLSATEAPLYYDDFGARRVDCGSKLRTKTVRR